MRFSSHFRGRSNRGAEQFTREGRYRDFDKHRDGRWENYSQSEHSQRECPQIKERSDTQTRIQAT